MKVKKYRSLTRKIVSFLVILGFLVALSSGIVGYIKFTRVITDMYSKETSIIGNIIVDYLDTKYLEETFEQLSNVNNEEELKTLTKSVVYDSRYSELIRFLDDIRRNTGITNAFIAGFTDKNGEIIEDGYYFAGVSGQRLDPEISIVGEEFFLDNSTNIIANIYETGQTPNIQETKETEYGPVMDAYIPVIRKNKVIGIVGVQEPMTSLINSRNDYIFNVILYSTIVTIGVILLFIYLNKRVLERPLNKISKAASEFVKNNNTFTEDLSLIKTNDELQTLAETFIKMEKDINTYIQNLEIITSEKERVETELNLAREIQINMLPRVFPPFPDRNEIDIYATMEPAKEVGGDFYDFFLIDEDHLGFVIADVSGKGIPAALFMVITKTLIKDHAKLGLSPGEVFTNVNNLLCESNGSDLFVTAWFGILDLKNGKLSYVNAGHNPPVIKRHDGSYEYLKQRSGLVLAGLEDMRYRQAELDLENGDRIFLYTDGVTEAQNSAEELYGEDRLINVLNENTHVDITDLLSVVRKSINDFVKEAEQFDDMTMLGIELKEVGKQNEN